MMKKYEKPQILIEKFEVSQHIADCFWTMNSDANGSCTGDANDQGMPAILFSDVQGCDVPYEFGEDMCYTNAQDGKVIFMS